LNHLVNGYKNKPVQQPDRSKLYFRAVSYINIAQC